MTGPGWCFHEDDERSRTDDSDEGTFAKRQGKGQLREVGQAVQDSSERVDGSGMDGMDGKGTHQGHGLVQRQHGD